MLYKLVVYLVVYVLLSLLLLNLQKQKKDVNKNSGSGFANSVDDTLNNLQNHPINVQPRSELLSNENNSSSIYIITGKNNYNIYLFKLFKLAS